MADVVRTSRDSTVKVAVLIAVTLVVLNGVFIFLSDLWAHDAPIDLTPIREAFGVMTLVIGGASFAAAFAPRQIGHGLAVVLGATAIIAGIASLAHGMTPVMGMTLLVVGGLMPLLAWYSLQHSRGAWSFLIALLAVFGTVTFFGAPKVRGLLGIGLWTALMVPGLLVVGTIALAMLREEYRERT